MLEVPELGAYAMHIGTNAWLGSLPQSSEDTGDISWTGTGPMGVQFYALRNGFIVFDFSQSADFIGGAVPSISVESDGVIQPFAVKAMSERSRIQYKRFDYMNATLFAIFSAYTQIQGSAAFLPQPVDPVNYFKATRDGHSWTLISVSQTIAKQPSSKQLISKETLNAALILLNRFFTIVGSGYQELLKLSNLSCHQYGLHQFASAHLIAWCISEAMLQQMWLSYQKRATHTKINSDRAKNLNSPNYSAASITQILSLAGILDDDILGRLDKARAARNKFAHSLTAITADQAGAAIRTAADMMSRVIGIQVHTTLAYSFFD